MALTKEQWMDIEKALIWYPGFSILMIDGYKITLRCVHDAKNSLKRSIMVFIDGKFNHEWVIVKDSEDPSFNDIRLRFLCKKISQRVTMNRLMRLRWRKKEAEKFVKENSFSYYRPDWTSFKALKSHLIKNNKDISLFDENKIAVEK